MNNTCRAEAVRVILSKKLTDYEKYDKDGIIERSYNAILRKLDNISENADKEKALKMLQAVDYLLETINY